MNTRDKIVELVPDCNGVIGLCVVLRAINKHVGDLYADTLGFIFWFEPAYGPDKRWNLEQDNYDAQSQETKDFIGTLLGVK